MFREHIFGDLLRTLRRAWPLAVATALGVVCFLAAQSVVVDRAASAPVAVTPYTVKTESYGYTGHPAGKLFERRTDARRSDGAMVLAGDLFPGTRYEHGARTLSLPDGTAVTLVDSLRAKITWPRASAVRVAQVRSALLSPPGNCAYGDDTFLGKGTVGDRPVDIVRGPLTGSNQLTSWRDPALGCVVLQARGETVQPDGKRTVISETKLVSLNIGEPDPSLFYLGAAYTEMSPSEVLHVQTERNGVPWNKHLQEQADGFDRVYTGTGTFGGH